MNSTSADSEGISRSKGKLSDGRWKKGGEEEEARVGSLGGPDLAAT